MSTTAAPVLFNFELPSSDNLTFMPLGVRYHLDQTGYRLSLTAWQALNWDMRARLAALPPEDGSAVRARFEAALTEALGGGMTSLERFAPESDPAWRQTGCVPDAVVRQATLHGVPAPALEQWAHLSPFQRYALAKLSRRDKKNHDFLPALTEFGLVEA